MHVVMHVAMIRMHVANHVALHVGTPMRHVAMYDAMHVAMPARITTCACMRVGALIPHLDMHVGAYDDICA